MDGAGGDGAGEGAGEQAVDEQIGDSPGEGEEEKGRLAARVRLAVAPLGDLARDKLRKALEEAFARGPQPHAVVRRYRSEPSPLVRNTNGSWRTGKLDAVLRGDFDLMAASQR